MRLPAWFARLHGWPAILWWLLTVWLLWLRPAGEPSGLPYGDKIGHFVLFAVWALCLLYGSQARLAAWQRVLLLSLLWAVVSEMGQAFTATRSAEIGDVLADMVGAVCGLALWYWRLAGWRVMPRQP